MRGRKMDDFPASTPAAAAEQNQEPEPEPAAAAAVDEGEEVEEEAEEVGEEGAEVAEAGDGKSEEASGRGDEVRPTLGDGFYEIETIRRKRVRKGQLQYLIKWKGWPETANTWEPVENLTACPEIIAAFEERYSRSPWKRRRSASKPQSGGESTSSPPQKKRHRTSSILKHHLPDGMDRRTSERIKVKQMTKKESRRNVGAVPVKEIPTHEVEHVKVNDNISGVIPVLSSHSSQDVEAIPPVQTSGETKDYHMDDAAQPLSRQSNQVTGARKRKSGCVRRFKQESTFTEQETIKPANEDVESSGGETANHAKEAENGERPHITKILSAVKYHASITNGIQEVSITFTALRSDGKEVLVDDKELKANYPLVLINYYEQHLRYNPNS